MSVSLCCRSSHQSLPWVLNMLSIRKFPGTSRWVLHRSTLVVAVKFRIRGRFFFFYCFSFLEQGTDEACDPSVFQVAVYMAKRDFVDHCDVVDPVGESGFCQIAGWWVVHSETSDNSLPLSDGVILIDPVQLKGKKGQYDSKMYWSQFRR